MMNVESGAVAGAAAPMILRFAIFAHDLPGSRSDLFAPGPFDSVVYNFQGDDLDRKAIMTATTARRSSTRRAREREPDAAPKSTAYGRSVLRALDRMKLAGPWQFGPKLSDRYFKR